MQTFPSAIPNAELAFAALRAIGAAERRADPADALEIVRRLASPAPRRPVLRRSPYPAGAVVEIHPPGAGAPSVAPAPGALRGFDEEVAGVALYRTVAPGRLGDRHVPWGATVMVGQRPAEKGEWLLVATGSGLHLVEAGQGGRPATRRSARVLGVVEGIVSDAGPLRRCA
ncbi:MAG TPA: hypothetical protein VN033_04830 [Vulgatibacter sp.]|nr:hypothetical protein [Vulgatibacter sp.]